MRLPSCELSPWSTTPNVTSRSGSGNDWLVPSKNLWPRTATCLNRPGRGLRSRWTAAAARVVGLRVAVGTRVRRKWCTRSHKSPTFRQSRDPTTAWHVPILWRWWSYRLLLLTLLNHSPRLLKHCLQLLSRCQRLLSRWLQLLSHWLQFPIHCQCLLQLRLHNHQLLEMWCHSRCPNQCSVPQHLSRNNVATRRATLLFPTSAEKTRHRQNRTKRRKQCLVILNKILLTKMLHFVMMEVVYFSNQT